MHWIQFGEIANLIHGAKRIHTAKNMMIQELQHCMETQLIQVSLPTSIESASPVMSNSEPTPIE
jgi:hypothetical protein